MREGTGTSQTDDTDVGQVDAMALEVGQFGLSSLLAQLHSVSTTAASSGLNL
jgi:hypothetical protein